MFFAQETPFKLGLQLRRPNQGYAVDNLKNSFTFYMPLRHIGLQKKSHTRSCTFPSIKKNLPIRQILLQDHFDGEQPFVYSLEGKKIPCENKRRTLDISLNLHNRTLSMYKYNFLVHCKLCRNTVRVSFVE